MLRKKVANEVAEVNLTDLDKAAYKSEKGWMGMDVIDVDFE